MLMHTMHSASATNGDEAASAGHTSWSFGSMFFLSLYLYRYLCAAGHPTNGWALGAALLPSVFAAWVGATRVIDYYHNASDVLAGAAIGVTVACLVFRVYVPVQRPEAPKRGEVLPLTGGDSPSFAQHSQSASIDIASLARQGSASRGGRTPFEMVSRQNAQPQHRSA